MTNTLRKKKLTQNKSDCWIRKPKERYPQWLETPQLFELRQRARLWRSPEGGRRQGGPRQPVRVEQLSRLWHQATGDCTKRWGISFGHRCRDFCYRSIKTYFVIFFKMIFLLRWGVAVVLWLGRKFLRSGIQTPHWGDYFSKRVFSMCWNPPKGRVNLCGWIVDTCAMDLWLEVSPNHQVRWKRKKTCHILAMVTEG